jgi:deoxyribonuclease IV
MVDSNGFERGPALGAHVSVAGGLAKAFANGERLHCNAIQIFVKNANQWRGRALEAPEVAEFRTTRTGQTTIGPVLAHASYLINLAANDSAMREKSIAALADELDRCSRLGVDGLVVHPGAHVGAGEDRGIELVAEALREVFAANPHISTRLLLENTAGQGTCLGRTLSELERMIAGSAGLGESGRLGVCLDTCHAFAAGYAIHEESGYQEFMAEVGERLGFANIGAFHLNDSAKPFASRKDRHEHIGQGEIGVGAFERLLSDPRVAHAPMVLETEPGEGDQGHLADLATLRSLRRGGR